MNINDKLYGFTVTEKRYVDELRADVYTLIYDKCGARLTFIDRDDDNKTFSITFKTLPEDSTGVFHILEHSVLCGSEKYPLKDPFVELLKGSLNTFLNAMTFQDKTMYPVASRNDKDFYNLVGIYMDAVLHPLVLKNPNAFYQEGWHYEVGDGGELSYKGVVLNEMKGDYSSPESVADRNINEMLYRGTPYEYDSGGDPDEITKLTYESFVAAHKKYYHPTYAELFLDGRVRLDEILPLISSYLSEYDRSEVEKQEFEIPRVTISEPCERTVYYEVKDGESTENKTRMCLGFVACEFDKTQKLFGINILQRALFSTNESEVKRAVIASGLCEDMCATMRDGIFEPSVLIDFINVKDGKCEELLELFCSELKRVAESGIEKEELISNLNFTEFQVRERDFGSLPIGVANAMVSLESLLYSDDPVQNFRCNEVFASLREGVESGYFERLINEVFLQNSRRATLIMLPSDKLADERREREESELSRYAASLNENDLANLSGLNEELARWQESEDSEYAKNTVPSLSIADISRIPRRVPTEISDCCGATALRHDIATNGIIYVDFYFDISDISAEELPYIALYNFLLTNLETKGRSASLVQRLIKANLGGFDTRMSAISKLDGGAYTPKVYLTASASALEGNKDKIPEIADEILNGTLFEDCTAIRNIIRQTVIASEESFASSGHQVAMGRVSAASSVEGACREYYNGYESYLVFKELDSRFDDKFTEIKERLYRISEKYLTRERLTVSITGSCEDGYIEKLVSVFKKGDKSVPVCKISPIKKRREGILIPARVSFAAAAGNLFEIGEVPDGSYDVVRSLVGYEYLWSEVRVKGGAYGAGMSAGISGNVGFYSYRDPNPRRTLDAFCGVPDFIREFAESGSDITKYIIGAVGDSEPQRTPRMAGAGAAVRYLRGISYDKECELRESMLGVNKAELLKIADSVETAVGGGAVCIVGPREALEYLELDEILKI